MKRKEKKKKANRQEITEERIFLSALLERDDGVVKVVDVVLVELDEGCFFKEDVSDEL
jgi:hypothetical protein